MKVQIMMKRILFSMLVLSAATSARAMNVDWAGTYRFEWTQVDRPSLGTPPERKAYGLNYLSLSPKIIASDGINIISKFDVLANQDFAYNNSQMGQLWGQSYTVTAGDTSRVNTFSNSKESTLLKVRQLYLNVNQEYGTLIVGRAPQQFGLGMTYDAGEGPFDHWASTQDVVGYKFIVGNFFFMPSIGRVADDGPAQSNSIQDEMLQLQYDSQDSGSMIGIYVKRRRSSKDANDTPVGVGKIGGLGASVIDGYSMQSVNFTLARIWEGFQFKMEAGFMNGDYGVQTSAAEFVKNNSYGFVAEMAFPVKESKWDWSIRFGGASGDDPSTADREGYYFDRNYDVAFLLFNHRLGGRDFLQTNLIKDTAHTLSNSLDDETISNAAFLSPRIKYAWNDRWDVVNTLTAAQLMVNPTNSLDFKKDLGVEWDLELVYKPREKVRWVNQLGLLAPGNAFKDGASALDNGFTFGFATKAAITF